MTNREYLATLSNYDLANYIYAYIIPVVGKSCNNTTLGVAEWLGQVDEFPDKRDSDCPLEAISEARMSFLDSIPGIDLLYTPDNGLTLQPKLFDEDEALNRIRRLQQQLYCKDCQEFNCDFCKYKEA